MADYLKELCQTININVIYTNNKLTVLSQAISNNMPCIRAHKLFKGCTDEVAKAIVNYYSGMDVKDESLKIIENYVLKNFESDKFRIAPPIEEFKKIFTNRIMSTKSTGRSDDPNLAEFEIAYIKKVDFWGESTDITHNGSFSAKGSEMIELDIEVNDFNY